MQKSLTTCFVLRFAEIEILSFEEDLSFFLSNRRGRCICTDVLKLDAEAKKKKRVYMYPSGNERRVNYDRKEGNGLVSCQILVI